LNILDHILLITTVSLDRWQHHCWFYYGRGWYVVEMMRVDSCWFQKVKWWLTFTNVCSQCMGKLLYIWILSSDG
jgi:hypothetical protein